MLTAYSATLDPTSIYDAITCLTSIYHSWDSWSEYISSLKRIIHPQGKVDQCSSSTQSAFRMLLLSADGLCFEKPIDDDDTSYVSQWERLVSLTSESDKLKNWTCVGIPPRLSAWRAAHRGYKTSEADTCWLFDIFLNASLRIQEATTYRTGE